MKWRFYGQVNLDKSLAKARHRTKQTEIAIGSEYDFERGEGVVWHSSHRFFYLGILPTLLIINIQSDPLKYQKVFC